MALPPVGPLNYKDRNVSYFEMLAIEASLYLLQYGIKLNFESYSDTILIYQHMKVEDGELAWELSKELNSWSEYFSEVANLIQKILLDTETEEREIQAIASINYDSDKVSNGNRLAYQDKEVIGVMKKRNVLKAFHDELQSKVKFLERAHYHCKSTFDVSQKSKFPVFKNN